MTDQYQEPTDPAVSTQEVPKKEEKETPVEPAKDSSADSDQVKELIQIAFDKGITEAIEEAKKLNNPYILDEFHDALTDDFYKKLVEAGKLEQR